MFGRTIRMALVAGALAAGLGACDARGPLATEALELSRPVPLDQTRIVFYTPANPAAWAASDTNVFVNRRRVGRVLRDGVFWADVAPGRQIITTSAEIGSSTVIATLPGEVVFVRLGGGLGNLAQFVSPTRVTDEEGRAAISGKRMTDTDF